MVCPKCNGRGWYENPRYPNPASWSYAGVPSFKCSKCRETGYIIGNISDILQLLKVLQHKIYDKELSKEIKQAIESIEKPYEPLPPDKLLR